MQNFEYGLTINGHLINHVSFIGTSDNDVKIVSTTAGNIRNSYCILRCSNSHRAEI